MKPDGPFRAFEQHGLWHKEEQEAFLKMRLKRQVQVKTKAHKETSGWEGEHTSRGSCKLYWHIGSWWTVFVRVRSSVKVIFCCYIICFWSFSTTYRFGIMVAFMPDLFFYLWHLIAKLFLTGLFWFSQVKTSKAVRIWREKYSGNYMSSFSFLSWQPDCSPIERTTTSTKKTQQCSEGEGGDYFLVIPFPSEDFSIWAICPNLGGLREFFSFFTKADSFFTWSSLNIGNDSEYDCGNTRKCIL